MPVGYSICFSLVGGYFSASLYTRFLIVINLLAFSHFAFCYFACFRLVCGVFRHFLYTRFLLNNILEYGHLSGNDFFCKRDSSGKPHADWFMRRMEPGPSPLSVSDFPKFFLRLILCNNKKFHPIDNPP